MPLSVTVNMSFTRPRGARTAAHFKPDRALLGEFHRVVDQIFQRRAQPHRDRRPACPANRRRRSLRVRRPLVSARAASESASASIRRRGRNVSCCSVSEPASALAASMTSVRQRGEMLGAGFDARGPAPLALAEIGARQQFAEREDAGERGADVVREDGERGLVARAAVCASPTRRRRRLTPRRLLQLTFCLALDRAMTAPGPHRTCHAAAAIRTQPAGMNTAQAAVSTRNCRRDRQRRQRPSPTMRRISTAVAPPARNSRKPVACVDFDSLRPSASRMSR